MADIEILNDENNIRHEPINDTPIVDTAPRLNETNNVTQNRICCNLKYVRLLRHLLSGRDGELTAIGQLFYGSMIFNNDNKLSSTLNQMSISNLANANRLGENIINFGGTPRFTNGQGAFWSARAINYAIVRNLYIDNTIKLLERIVREYNKAINRVTDEQLRVVLQNIVNQHQSNIQTLSASLNSW